MSDLSQSSVRNPSSAPEADPLPIAGLTPFSMVDWPNHLVATVFTQGCSWNCPYCHNPALRDVTAPGAVPWSRVVSLAHARRGLLDGFVFSGGEPTRHRGLKAAISEVRDLGFSIGLHTNGMYPALLAELLRSGLIDWVGLDIKAVVNVYAEVMGAVNSAAGVAAAKRAWESLEVVKKWSARPESFEVRTTVFDCEEQLQTLPKLGRSLTRAGVRNWAIQRSRDTGTSAEFSAAADVVKPSRQCSITEAIERARREFPEVVVR